MLFCKLSLSFLVFASSKTYFPTFIFFNKSLPLEESFSFLNASSREVNFPTSVKSPNPSLSTKLSKWTCLTSYSIAYKANLIIQFLLSKSPPTPSFFLEVTPVSVLTNILSGYFDPKPYFLII